MGNSDSSLKPQLVKPLVRPDTMKPLPSFSLDSCKFTDGSYGFLVTTMDLAKNTESYSMSVKFVYSPSENTYVYVGKDESLVSFTKDRLTGTVVCSFKRFDLNTTIVRHCVTLYESIDNLDIDRLADLFTSKQ
jgi:hypothetical protein